MKRTKSIAACGMMAALSIVILVLGAVLEIGMYAAPMIAGLCLLPIGRNYGKRDQATLWIAVSLLSFILVQNVEENLMYLGIFGCYPVIYPLFRKLPKGLRILAKAAYFNLVTLAIEALILWVIAPEAMELWMAALLLALGNLTFWLYDFLLPRAELRLGRMMEKILP